MPQDAEVGYIYDGALRGDIRHVWLTRSGRVALAGEGEVVYSDQDRPADAPLAKDEKHWHTPEEEDPEL